MPFTSKYIVTPRYLSKPSKRRSGFLIPSTGIKFIVAHDTGNPNSTASNNVDYYERTRNLESASAHIFVDDREILECVPALTGTPEKAWHVLYNATTDDRIFGCDANDAAIGVEYCFGEKINADEAYRKYVWVIAYLCERFQLDPATAIVGHYFLDPTRRTDPVTGLAQSRRTYDQLLKDIVFEYQACRGSTVSAVALASNSTQGSTQAIVKLNVRKGFPKRTADIHQTVPKGTTLSFIGWTNDGEPVNGNSKWFKTADNNFFWSGGVVA